MLRPLAILFGGLALIGCRSEVEPQAEEEAGVVELFDGESLDGWRNFGGGNFYVEEGAIVGEATTGLPNSFLATEETYDDFELEVEFKVDPRLNSGVQIRSNVYPEETTTTRWNGRFDEDGERQLSERVWEEGRFWGYQVEIDPSERGWTGALYEEAGRGFLHAPEKTDAFKPGAWNHFRILADGETLKTWLNGEPVAEVEDDLTARGHVALQLHGIGNNEEKEGATVQWRGLRLREIRE